VLGTTLKDCPTTSTGVAPFLRRARPAGGRTGWRDSDHRQGAWPACGGRI